MKIIILTFAILVSVEATAFSLKDRCSCSEYQTELVCSSMGYCSWIGNTCVDLQCQTVSYASCTAESTMYKCGWSETNNKCQSKSYTCNDITIMDNCKPHYGLDCIWQVSTQQCTPFTCTGIDLNKYFNASGVCGPPQIVDCSTLSTSACSSGIYGGNGKFCYVNDKGLCKSYNEQPKSCSDYSDLSVYCNALCSYDTSQGICTSNACSKYTTQTECNIIIDYYALTITPCYWTGYSCRDASVAEIEQFNVEACLIYTMEHYAWDYDSQRCNQCTKFSLNPALNQDSQSDNSADSNTNNGNSTTDTTSNGTNTSGNNTNTTNNYNNNSTLIIPSGAQGGQLLIPILLLLIY